MSSTKSQKLKILRVAQQVYPKAPGGGSYHVHALSRDQGRRGHDVELLTVSESEHGYKDDHYDVTVKPVSASLSKNQLSLGVLKSLVNLDDYDVVHAHSHLRATTNFCALSKPINRTPLLITNHGTHSQSFPYWFSEAYNQSVGRLTMNRSDVVFCYTAEEKQKLRNFGVRAKIEVVHNGIDHERFRPDVEPDPRVDNSGPSILFVGRLAEGKRPQDALIAFEKVNREYPTSKLFLCGEGPLQSDIVEIAEQLGCRESVRLLGRVEYENMPSIFTAADLLVLPSKTEGFPRVILEALATETPVVTSDLEQITALIHRVGKIAPIGDTKSLATSIISLIEDKSEIQSMGERGRDIVVENFSWSDTVNNVTKITEQVVKKNQNEYR